MGNAPSASSSESSVAGDAPPEPQAAGAGAVAVAVVPAPAVNNNSNNNKVNDNDNNNNNVNNNANDTNGTSNAANSNHGRNSSNHQGQDPSAGAAGAAASKENPAEGSTNSNSNSNGSVQKQAAIKITDPSAVNLKAATTENAMSIGTEIQPKQQQQQQQPPPPPKRPTFEFDPSRNRLRCKRVKAKRTCFDSLGDLSNFTFKQARPVPSSQASLTTVESSGNSSSEESSTSSGSDDDDDDSSTSSSTANDSSTNYNSARAESQKFASSDGRRSRKPSAKRKALEAKGSMPLENINNKKKLTKKQRREAERAEQRKQKAAAEAARYARGPYGAARTIPSHVQPADVLLSTRRQHFDHVGNRIYLDVVRHYLPYYRKSAAVKYNLKKIGDVIDVILKQMQQLNPGMRFLNGDFREASSRQLREAVGHTLRVENASALRQSQLPSSSSKNNNKKQTKTSSIVLHPHDVVRHRNENQQPQQPPHEGTLALHQYCQEVAARYQQTDHDPAAQRRIIDSVLWRVQQLDPPGRFLECKDNHNHHKNSSNKIEYTNTTIDQARADVAAILDRSAKPAAAQRRHAELQPHDVVLSSGGETKGDDKVVVVETSSLLFRQLCATSAGSSAALRHRAVDHVWKQMRAVGGRFLEPRRQQPQPTEGTPPVSKSKYVPVSEFRARQAILQALRDTAPATAPSLDDSANAAAAAVSKPPDAAAASAAAATAAAPLPSTNVWQEFGAALAAAAAGAAPLNRPPPGPQQQQQTAQQGEGGTTTVTTAPTTANETVNSSASEDKKQPAVPTVTTEAAQTATPSTLQNSSAEAAAAAPAGGSPEKPVEIIDLTTDTATATAGQTPAVALSHLGPAVVRTKTPNPNDIICGHTPYVSARLGNQIYRQLCVNARVTFKNTRSSMKWRLADWIIHQICALDPPGRFLMQMAGTENDFVELPFDLARKMVLVDLRMNQGEPEQAVAIPVQFLMIRDPLEPVGPQRTPEQEFETLDKPHPHDVIVNGGSSHLAHPGNQVFLKYCWNARHAYCSSRPDGAPAVVDMVIKAVFSRSPPGRFLEPNPDGNTYRDASVEQMRGEVFRKLLEGHSIATMPEDLLPDKLDLHLHPETPTLEDEQQDVEHFVVLPYYQQQVPQSDEDDDGQSVTEASVNSPSTGLAREVSPDNQPAPTKSYYREAMVHPDSVDPTIGHGTRLAVYWPLDNIYYKGAVEERVENFVRMEYDDGITEWLNLTKHKYRILSKEIDISAVEDEGRGLTVAGGRKHPVPKTVVAPSQARLQEEHAASAAAAAALGSKKRPEPKIFTAPSEVLIQKGFAGMSESEATARIPTAHESYPTQSKQEKNAKAVSAIKQLIAVPPSPYQAAEVAAVKKHKVAAAERVRAKMPPALAAIAPDPAVEEGVAVAPFRPAAPSAKAKSSTLASPPFEAEMPDNPLSVEECRMLLSLAARFGPTWYEVAPRPNLVKMVAKEFSGRSLEALVEIWDEQIRPSITAFVNSQKSKEEKRDFVRKADYEKYDVGILHAAARSQYLGMQVPQGTDE